MEESPWICTRTPARRRLGSFQDCWLSIRPTLQEQPVVRFELTATRLRIAASSKRGTPAWRRRHESNALVWPLQGPAFPLSYVAGVGACGAIRTPSLPIKNRMLVHISFTCVFVGPESLELSYHAIKSRVPRPLRLQASKARCRPLLAHPEWLVEAPGFQPGQRHPKCLMLALHHASVVAVRRLALQSSNI